MQHTFDFSRAEQLHLIRQATLPATRTGGGRVSAATLKLVLRTIDDHGGGRRCYLKHETIAAECGLSMRTSKRAVEALVSMGVLIAERRRTPKGGVCNHYTIVWSELAVRARPAVSATCSGPVSEPVEEPTKVPNRPENQSATVTDQSATVTDQSATVTDQSATVTDQSATSGTFKEAPGSASEAPKESPPPKPPATAAAVEAVEPRCPQAAGAVAEATWGDVARACRDAGLRAAGDAVQAAKQSDLTASDALAAVDTYRANSSRFRTPRAILFYFRNHAWPIDDVVRPEVAAAAEAERRAAADAARKAAQARRADAAEWRRRFAALEARHGPAVDRLAADELAELLRDTFASDFDIERYHRDPAGSFQRFRLLEAIATSRTNGGSHAYRHDSPAT